MRMMGNVLTMMERLDDEYTKLLQHTDAHSTNYVTKYTLIFEGGVVFEHGSLSIFILYYIHVYTMCWYYT